MSSSRDYFVEAWSAQQEVRLQFQNRYTASLKGMYAHKTNLQGAEKVQQYHADLSFMYRLLNRGTVSLTAEYVYMKGDVGENSSGCNWSSLFQPL